MKTAHLVNASSGKGVQSTPPQVDGSLLQISGIASSDA